MDYGNLKKKLYLCSRISKNGNGGGRKAISE